MTNYHSDKNMVHNIHQQKCYSIDNLTDQSSKSCLNNKRLCPVTHDDSQSIVHCINDSNHQQQRPPPPLMSYSTMINSPARSKRGSPSSDPDEDDFQVITRIDDNNGSESTYVCDRGQESIDQTTLEQHQVCFM
ncbi:unnamed protein product [Rotaria sordida]|uniref:Uncharacterized protein n=1 Tax=Rotaria sordida TaxID=392033 RepID=A0A814M589_9BILA|nr:unnamed protein product [Rotaria sordida]